MFKTKRNIVLALALCALLLPMTMTAKDMVERPFKYKGDAVVILDLRFYPICPWWIESEVGEATHMGLYTSSGAGQYDMLTGEITGSGCVTAANGDQVFWEMTAPGIITWMGGTGRFEGASGSMTQTITGETIVQEGYFLKIAQSFTGVGTITY